MPAVVKEQQSAAAVKKTLPKTLRSTPRELLDQLTILDAASSSNLAPVAFQTDEIEIYGEEPYSISPPNMSTTATIHQGSLDRMYSVHTHQRLTQLLFHMPLGRDEIKIRSHFL